MKNKRFIFLIFCSVFVLTGSTQNISLRNIPILKQLPNPTVTRLLQDSEGFLWFGTPEGLYRYDGYRVLTFRADAKNPKLLTDNDITALAEAGKYLWIGTKKGVNILDKRTCKLTVLNDSNLSNTEIKFIRSTTDKSIWIGTNLGLYRCKDSEKSFRQVLQFGTTDLYEDRSGNIWLTAWMQGLYRYDKKKEQFARMPAVGNLDNPFKIFQDTFGHYWIGSWNDGLYQFFPHKQAAEMYKQISIKSNNNNLEENTIYSIVEDSKIHYVWAVGYNGIYAFRYDEATGKVRQVDISSQFSATASNVYSEIIPSRSGDIWLASFGDGVLSIDFNEPTIENFDFPELKKYTNSKGRINAIYANENEIWFYQNRYKLGILNRKENKTTFYNHSVNNINTFRSQPHKVFLSNYSTVTVVEKRGNSLVETGKIELTSIDANCGTIKKCYEDRNNNIWFMTNNSLFVLSYSNGKIEKIDLPIQHLSDITEDVQSNMWISSENSGLCSLNLGNNAGLNNPESAVFKSENTKNVLANNNITAICADKKGRLWAGTKEGNLLMRRLNDNEFTDLKDNLELADGRILNMIEDNAGNIWFTTYKAIYVFNFDTKAFRKFTVENDICISSNINSCYKDRTGKIYFGGNGGVCVFNPAEILLTTSVAQKVFVTDVKINNISVFDDNNNQKLDLLQQKLELSPADRNIELYFSSLHYVRAQNLRFAYRLKGEDKDWIYLNSKRHFAIYNKLSKGKHELQIRASNENGVWSDDYVTFTIYQRPVFYETWWAYLLYFLIVAAAVFYFYKRTKNKIRMEQDLKMAKIEKQKSEELAQTKLRYFTNISHEFLTPLTIINCSIDDAEMSHGEKITQLKTIRYNAERLKRLLQQVIDFRKMESGNLKLKALQGDIASFVRDICYNHFVPLMKKKNITFSFSSNVNMLLAYFDADKIDKIIFNLLSNAYKYTPEGGEVNIMLEKQINRLKIIVSDTGIGIAEKDISKIFTRFYNNKMNNGGNTNGIGLSLTKELVELHKGTITVESQEGAGTKFTVEIPIDRESYRKEELGVVEANLEEMDMEILTEKSETSIVQNGKSKLLLIDDDEELLALMKKLLAKNYFVTTVGNGKEALEQIRNQKANDEFDVIISDVMMPEIDGLELCRRLKNNIETSHIPVILLTAKNNPDDRIGCYEAGADAYISKPFQLNVLEARINNFLLRKKKNQREFKQNAAINISQLEIKRVDEDFLKKAVSLIENEINSAEITPDYLADKMCMSRPTLYRKLVSLTGLAPRDFIRNVRLKYARVLLQDKFVSIADVAYSTGFSDPKHFSTCFKEEFGVSPKTYQQQNE